MVAKYSRFILFGLLVILSLVACQEEEQQATTHTYTQNGSLMFHVVL